MEDQSNKQFQPVVDTARFLLDTLIASDNTYVRQENDVPFYLHVASLLYAMAVHNSVVSGEEVEEIINQNNRTHNLVYDALQKGAATRSRHKLSAN